MRLIDADALLKSISFVCRTINNAPTVDAVPVLHGKWIYKPGKIPYCSICGEYSDDADCGKGNYCPNCGAKMDEVSE